MIASNYHVTRTRTGRISSGWTCDEVGDYPGASGQPESVVVVAAGLTDDAARQQAHARLIQVFGEEML